ncbi:MAG: hypothetical protein ABL858_09145 [Candidatus Nitrotoga sp.]
MKKIILIMTELLMGSFLMIFFIGQAMAVPTFQAAGTAQEGDAQTHSPAWPAHAVGDIALLFIETAGSEAATLSTPAGFAAVANSPQATGITPDGTRITVFWARATSTTMAAPTVAFINEHFYSRILTYRNVISTGNPWDVTGGGVKATASTTVTVTGVTTTVADTRIVQVVAHDLDEDLPVFSGQTNTNLTGITERSDAGTRVGQGGGFAVWDGVKATAGATGNTTANVTSSINAFLTIALKPLLPPTVAKSFSPTSIAIGGTSTLTVTLTNANTTAITGAAFTDTYPANVTNTGTPGLTNTCGGTATAAANGSSLTLSGGTIPASGSCTLTVAVTSSVAGSYLNSTGSVTTTNAGSGTAATATLTVGGSPSLVFMKTVSVTSDPVNGATNPKNIPGAEVLYNLRVTNTGAGTVDNNTTIITDPIPANSDLFVSDLGVAGSGPIVFVQGTPTSNLTWTFTSLASLTDDVDFSNDHGATWTFVPTPPYDTAVNRIRLNPKGTMAGASGGNNPFFELRFRVRIK